MPGGVDCGDGDCSAGVGLGREHSCHECSGAAAKWAEMGRELWGRNGNGAHHSTNFRGSVDHVDGIWIELPYEPNHE